MDGSLRLMDCHRDCPFRPVTWRWERAGLLREHGILPGRPHDDHWIARAIRFQVALTRAGADPSRNRLAEAQPAPFAAYHLWRQGEHPWRWALEARLLAGEPPEAIAARCGLSAAAVVAYEALFFNVRDRLGATDYISLIVIGPIMTHGAHPRDTGTLWRWLAYRHGPAMLDYLIAAGVTPVAGRPERPGQALPDLVDAAEVAMTLKMLFASLTMRVNKKTQIPLVKLYVKLQTAGRKGRDRGRSRSGSGSDLSAHVRAMAQGLDRILGGKGPEMPIPPADGAGSPPQPGTGDPGVAADPGAILPYPDPGPTTDPGRRGASPRGRGNPAPARTSPGAARR